MLYPQLTMLYVAAFECDRAAVGGPARGIVGTVILDKLARGARSIGGGDVDIGERAIVGFGRGAGNVGDAGAIRRPLRVAQSAVLLRYFSSLFGFGFDDPQVREAVVAIHHAGVILVFLRLLLGVGERHRS